MPDTALHPLGGALSKFWAPVPWMLEAAVVLEIVLGKYVEAGIIAGLLAFNATATGAGTKFGRTAELVRTAHVESSQQKAVLRVVRNLAMFNGVLIVMLVGYAYAQTMPGSEIIGRICPSCRQACGARLKQQAVK